MSSALCADPAEGEPVEVSVTGVLSFMFIQTGSSQNGLKIILYGLARRSFPWPGLEISGRCRVKQQVRSKTNPSQSHPTRHGANSLPTSEPRRSNSARPTPNSSKYKLPPP